MRIQKLSVSGYLRDERTREPIPGALVELSPGSIYADTDLNGRFYLIVPFQADSVTFSVRMEGYRAKHFRIHMTSLPLEMGDIYLQTSSGDDLRVQHLPLGETDLYEEEDLSTGTGFLQAGRDVFLNRASFDFSPAFFRVRGYDRREAAVFFNGIPMNRFYDGRPQWNNWGGLNDVSRNQEFRMGLKLADAGFGGYLGTTLMDISPSALREGFRFTTSASNRNYSGRLMATYNSGIRDSGLGILFSVSKRLAGQGYMEGTSYDALSILGSIEFQLTDRHEFNLTGVYTSNLRGRSSALTPETIDMGGRKYNPYWGLQNGKIRNSRMRYISEPFLNFRYGFKGRRIQYTLAAGYQWGQQFRTRLGYFNAPNPDPSYYRNLPSFYLNSPIGPNLINARESRDGFQNSRQINWGRLYKANQNTAPTGTASYILLSDRSEEDLVSINNYAAWQLGRGWQLRSGILMQRAKRRNYSRLEDLLGAPAHRDMDPFSNTRNDLEGTLEKSEGDRIGYDYQVFAAKWEAFAALEADFDRWGAFLAVGIGGAKYQREGLFQNQRFPDHSKGIGKEVGFKSQKLKAGLNYRLSGRHWFSLDTGASVRPPIIRNLYINPRDHMEVIPNARNEQVHTADISYNYRGHSISSRLSLYYSRFMHQAEVNFFYTDTGLGSGFVQEVTTGVDKLFKGLELGLGYDLGPSVQLSVALALGDNKYASSPDVALYFLPKEEFAQIGQEEDRLSLGPAGLKNRHVSSGPSRAFSIGLQYRDSAYWWAGFTANYMAGHYTDLSILRYTQSFVLNPDTRLPQSDIGPEAVDNLLRQKALPPVYLLNLNGGKSWKTGRHYISFFLSLGNLFDAFFFSGGYDQGRNGNYAQLFKDGLSGRPSFGPKFWPGYGRTFFANLSWSF